METEKVQECWKKIEALLTTYDCKLNAAAILRGDINPTVHIYVEPISGAEAGTEKEEAPNTSS